MMIINRVLRVPMTTTSLSRRSIVWALTLILAAGASACAAASDDQEIQEAVALKIAQYVQSINDADPALAASVWADGSDTSAVMPFGRFTGWSRVRDSLYTGFLQKTFTKRHLQQSNVVVRGDGDVAWATFDWTFEGTLASGEPMSSQGWESQVYRRQGGDWRIVHMHYSGMQTGGPAIVGP
jgi:ketosteroid isomerase-like protein